MPKIPTAELVAVAYGKAVLGWASNTAPVVTTLPDVSSWSATGALQVAGIVGTTTRDNDLRDVVVSFDAWGARPGSDKPPWGQANELLEIVRASSFAEGVFPLWLGLTPPGVYSAVQVQAAIPITEPRRLPDPDASRAHYTMDFRLIWVRL